MEPSQRPPGDYHPLGDDPDAYLERLNYRADRVDHGKLGYVLGLTFIFLSFMALFLCGLLANLFLHAR